MRIRNIPASARSLTYLAACLSVFAGAFPALAQHSWTGCADLKDGDFRKVSLVDRSNYPALGEPVKMDIAKDGSIYWMERGGAFRKWDAHTKAVSVLGQVDAHVDNPRGGMGLRLDPDFDKNGFVYVVYHPNVPPYQKHTLSRFTVVNGKAIDEKAILSVPLEANSGYHASGALAFDDKGNLFWGVGDNTSPSDIGGQTVGGYAPIAAPYATMDARRTAANTNHLAGKILRIHPEADGSYSIPPGNLFPPAPAGAAGAALTRPEIYSMGHRMPFNIWFDKRTGWLFVGEVGPDAAAADGSKGPAAQDEFNVVKSPGNYGWPFLGGHNLPYHDYDYATGKSGPLFDPEHLRNDSPHNTGLKDLPPGRPALLAYGHDGKSADQARFPILGGANRGTSIGGPVYRYDAALDSKIKLPPHFDNVWFMADFMREKTFAATLDSTASAVLEVKNPFPGLTFANIINGDIGPDGALYVIEYGTAWYNQNAPQKIARVEYTGTCLPPPGPDGLATSPERRPRHGNLRVNLERGCLLYSLPRGAQGASAQTALGLSASRVGSSAPGTERETVIDATGRLR